MTAPRSHSGRPRPVFVALWLAWVVVCLEGAAWIGVLLYDGRIYRPRSAAEHRAAARAEAADSANLVRALGEHQPGSVRRQVLHPYFGYVLDPASAERELPVDELGFFSSAPATASDHPSFVIGVFGGSVADLLVRSHGREIAEELAREEALTGQPIQLRNFAMGGYKQPQQLMILGYLLSMGERLDLVVNLDGFNEVALSLEAFRDGVDFPFFPREWSLRLRGLAGAEELRIVGEIAHLAATRTRRADWCASWLALSPACHLTWSLLDDRLAQRQSRLRAELKRRVARSGSWAHRPRGGFDDEAELLDAIAAHWEKSSRAMHALCRAFGIRYVHFLQPNLHDPMVSPAARSAFATQRPESSPWVVGVRLGYPRLSASGERLVARGVEFHDLRGLFAKTARAAFADSCCHLNEDGTRLLGQAIVRALRSASIETDP